MTFIRISGGEETTRGLQLWIALPEELEHSPPQSRYLSADEVPTVGGSRVVLGNHAGSSSGIPTPQGINYLDAQLQAGDRWTYRPPAGHNVAWLAVSQGEVQVGERVSAGELVVFEGSAGDIVTHAVTAARLVLGSAI